MEQYRSNINNIDVTRVISTEKEQINFLVKNTGQGSAMFIACSMHSAANKDIFSKSPVISVIVRKHSKTCENFHAFLFPEYINCD